MRRVFLHVLPDHPDLFRRRTIGMLLAIVVHVLGILLFYFMAPPLSLKKPEPELRDFQLLSVPADKPAPKPQPRASTARQQRKPTENPPPPQLPLALPSPLKMMIVGSDVFAASDISRMPSYGSRSAPPSPAEVDDGVVGKGPGGAPLYDAELIHAPSFAEVMFYMPKDAPRRSVSGMMMCQMMPDNRLDSCRELSETPPGSGMARALRQSAWMFRVRPYRIGNRPVVGTWVRVEYTLTVQSANDPKLAGAAP